MNPNLEIFPEFESYVSKDGNHDIFPIIQIFITTDNLKTVFRFQYKLNPQKHEIYTYTLKKLDSYDHKDNTDLFLPEGRCGTPKNQSCIINSYTYELSISIDNYGCSHDVIGKEQRPSNAPSQLYNDIINKHSKLNIYLSFVLDTMNYYYNKFLINNPSTLGIPIRTVVTYSNALFKIPELLDLKIPLKHKKKFATLHDMEYVHDYFLYKLKVSLKPFSLILMNLCFQLENIDRLKMKDFLFEREEKTDDVQAILDKFNIKVNWSDFKSIMSS
jgi:hypothetical protein